MGESGARLLRVLYTGHVSDQSEQEARARRAARRRATWGPGEWVPLGTPKPPLHDDATPEERLGRLWQLTCQVWAFAGKEIQRLPRHEWPIEIFEIEHARTDAPG